MIERDDLRCLDGGVRNSRELILERCLLLAKRGDRDAQVLFARFQFSGGARQFDRSQRAQVDLTLRIFVEFRRDIGCVLSRFSGIFGRHQIPILRHDARHQSFQLRTKRIARRDLVIHSDLHLAGIHRDAAALKHRNLRI